MGLTRYGTQAITFAVEASEDIGVEQKWIKVPVQVGDTCKKIAARYGHPELARKIARRNDIRNVRQVLLHKPRKKKDRRILRVPAILHPSQSFQVMAGDEPPKIVGGYAKFDIIDRPERVGITRFTGYDPVEMDVPIQFEAWTAWGADGRERKRDEDEKDPGKQIEERIELLERMAGRGNFKGAGTGPPAVVHLSVTGADGKLVPLIDPRLQKMRWRIVDIAWGDGALRDPQGRRVRQTATVRVRQHNAISLLSRSTAKRHRKKKGKGGK